MRRRDERQTPNMGQLLLPFMRKGSLLMMQEILNAVPKNITLERKGNALQGHCKESKTLVVIEDGWLTLHVYDKDLDDAREIMFQLQPLVGQGLRSRV